MKKTLAVIGILAGAVGAYAQGSLDWSDGQFTRTGGYLISIMSPNPDGFGAGPTVEQTGDTVYDTPANSANYGGGWVGNTSGVAPGGGVGVTPTDGPAGYDYTASANFEVGLYVDTSLAALTTDILTGMPVATTGIQGGSPGNAGIYGNTLLTYTSPTIAVGMPVYVGIAAWDTVYGGDPGSYAAALQGDPHGGLESTSAVVLGTLSTPAGLTGIGLTSFSLVVPEPSTVALGVIGASLFLARLRRKQ